MLTWPSPPRIQPTSGLGEIEDAVGDAGVVHQAAGEDEERHCEQREAVDAVDHAVHHDDGREAGFREPDRPATRPQGPARPAAPMISKSGKRSKQGSALFWPHSPGIGRTSGDTSALPVLKCRHVAIRIGIDRHQPETGRHEPVEPPSRHRSRSSSGACAARQRRAQPVMHRRRSSTAERRQPCHGRGQPRRRQVAVEEFDRDMRVAPHRHAPSLRRSRSTSR